MTGVITGIAWAVGVASVLWGAVCLFAFVRVSLDDKRMRWYGHRLGAWLVMILACLILAGACFGWLFGGGA